MKVFKEKYNYIWIAIVLVIGILLRVNGYSFESQDYCSYLLPWYEKIASLTVKNALATQVGDYNILYQNLILLLTRLPGSALVNYKLLSGIFDIILATAVYFVIKELADKKWAALGFAAAFLLPTIWLNSSFWAQCDSMYVAMVIWSLYFFYKKKDAWAFAFLGLAFALKLQTVFVLPFVILLLLYRAEEGQLKIWHLLIAPFSYGIPFVPNIAAGRELSEVIAVYGKQVDAYHNMVMNYPSVWSLITLNYDTDYLWAIVVTLLAVVTVMILAYKNKADIAGKHFWWAVFILTYTCVLFLPAMHERYDFLYIILLIILVFQLKRGWLFLGILEYISLETYIKYLYGHVIDLKFFAVINIAVYAIVVFAFYLELNGRLKPSDLFERKQVADNTEEKYVVSRSDWFYILIITIIFFILGSLRLGSMKSPETMVTLTNEEGISEIDIPFNSVEDVDYIYMYLGRTIEADVNVFAARDGIWDRAHGVNTVHSVFSWNLIPVNASTDMLALMISSDIEIGEIVCYNNGGEVIEIGDNVDARFMPLFDEQNCLNTPPTYYDQTMFDEVYHGRTAYEMLHGMEIYENTHPPLGKILISIGIAVFGMNPFGYRIVCLLFGTAMIPFIYLFVLRMTRKSSFAILAGVLMCTEFMHYTLSRIATIDIIVAFFILALFYWVYAFVLEEKEIYIFLAGMSFALAAATKWIGLYAVVGAFVIFLAWAIWKINGRRETATKSKWLSLICIFTGSFIVLPAAVYVLSYIPFLKPYPDKNILEHAIANSISMFRYHLDVNEPHTYASAWYSWLIDWVPLLDARHEVGANVSVVVTLVNPLVCYGGLIAFAHNLYMAFREKNKNAAVLSVLYCCMLVPWMFITRTVFIYQYFVCSIVLILLICNSLYSMKFKNEMKIIKITAISSIALFIIFFPLISGMEASPKYTEEILEILPRWWF